MIPKERVYPVFEANQVLTNRHLNSLFTYLEEQDRLTRTNLIGIGIICGLNSTVASDFSSITINRGCAVTSEGHVIVIPDDPNTTNSDEIVLTGWKTYTPPAEIAYPPFKKSGNTNFDLVELFPSTEPGIQPLNQLFLQGKVLLLYVEANLADLKTCSPNSCDDKGQEVNVIIRKLLISKVDMDLLLAAVDDPSASFGSDFNAQLGLPDLHLRRFDVLNTGVDTAMEIFEAYRKILLEAQADGSNTLFTAVEKALRSAYQAFKPVVGNITADDSFAGKLQIIQNRFASDFHNNRIVLTQYYYDFIADLIAAYQEFREAAIRWRVLCCPDARLFPRHIMVGEVIGAGVNGNKIYRHYFRPSAASSGHQGFGNEVRTLFHKLVLLIENFEIPALPLRSSPSAVLRITPSKYGDFPFSKKAIPFYYKVNNGNPALFTKWSYEKTSLGKANQNLSYHADQYGAPPFILRSLEYDHEEQNFYRVEGHVGLQWREAVKELLNKIRRYRLPIDLIALNADQFAVTKDPQPGRCIDNDLDVIYKSWLKEAQCLFEKKVNFFSSFDLAKNKFTRIAGLNIAAAVTGTPITRTRSSSTSRPGAVSSVATGATIGLGTRFGGALASFDVGGAVFNSEGSIGEAIKEKIGGTAGNVTAAELLASATESLQTNEKVRGMSVEQYNVVVGSPVKLIGTVAELADVIPDDSRELEINSIQEKYNQVKSVASAYLDDLIKIPDDFVFIPPNEKNKAIEELKNLLDNCLDKRLNELAAEIQRRKKAAAEAIWFSNYVKKHPDLKHCGGVPVGGTLVIVFRETPNTPVPGDTGGINPGIRPELVGDIADLLISAEAIKPVKPGEGKGGTSADNILKNTNPLLLRKKLSGQQVTLLTSAFDKAGLALDLNNLIQEGIFEFDNSVVLPEPAAPNVPEGIVIADFFLPYRCCSDCPPVQFVLPPPKPSFLTTAGCTNADGRADVLITTLAGEPPFEIKIGAGTGTQFQTFDPEIPIQLAVGTTQLILRDSQGTESQPVHVQIEPAMKIVPGAKICNDAGDAYNLELNITGGKAPFFINDQTPLESVPVAGGHRLLSGPFVSGVSTDLIIRDSSSCPAQIINVMHECRGSVPIANVDTASTSFNSPVTINVLGNDTGNDLSITIMAQPTEGTVTVNPDNTITFVPKPTVSNKTVAFTYLITNASGQTSQSSVSVHVGARECTLPCGGQALRGHYPIWLTAPEEEMIYRFTEIARLAIRDESRTVIFEESLLEFFNAEFSTEQSISNANLTNKLKRLFKRINDRITDKLGRDFFRLGLSDDGVFNVEHFACHTFLLDIAFGLQVKPGPIPVNAHWRYSENGVEVSQSDPGRVGFKIPVFGIDQIDKCADPVTTKSPGRINITNIKGGRAALAPVVETELDASTRFHWILEWSKQSELEREEVSPEFVQNGKGKARLIIVDKSQNWDYFEKMVSVNSGPTPRSTGRARKTTGAKSAAGKRSSTRKAAGKKVAKTAAKKATARTAVKTVAKRATKKTAKPRNKPS